MSMTIVVAAALRDADGRWLMQRRPADKAHGGLWEFPGGKVEPGEAPVQALARELYEELAITVAPGAFDPMTFAVDVDAGVLLLLYRCTSWAGEPEALAASALRWDVPDALARLPMPPLDVPLVAALARADTGGDRTDVVAS